MRFDNWTIILGIFAAANLANGIWMLIDPGHWFVTLPAAVPDTGPLNSHLVRDLGCLYVVMGLGLGAAAVRPKMRVWTLVVVAAWNASHALVHVTDTLSGRLTVDHWLIDAPGIYIPSVILIAIAWRISRNNEAESFLT